MNKANKIKMMNQVNLQETLGENLMPFLYLYNRSAFNQMFSFVHEIRNTLYKVSQFIPETGNKEINVLWNIQEVADKMKKVFCHVRGATIASIHMDLGGTLTTNVSIHMDLPSDGSPDPKSIWIDAFVEQQSRQSTWISAIARRIDF